MSDDSNNNPGTPLGNYFRENPQFSPAYRGPTPYQVAVRNLARFIRSPENLAQIETGNDNLTAFQAATVLGIAFEKDPTSVVIDLVNAPGL